MRSPEGQPPRACQSPPKDLRILDDRVSSEPTVALVEQRFLELACLGTETAAHSYLLSPGSQAGG